MASMSTAQGPSSISTAMDVAQTPAPVPMVPFDSEKGEIIDTPGEPEDLKPFPDAIPDLDAQHGIQKIEAVTLSWSKASLAALLIKYAISTHVESLYIALS